VSGRRVLRVGYARPEVSTYERTGWSRYSSVWDIRVTRLSHNRFGHARSFRSVVQGVGAERLFPDHQHLRLHLLRDECRVDVRLGDDRQPRSVTRATHEQEAALELDDDLANRVAGAELAAHSDPERG